MKSSGFFALTFRLNTDLKFIKSISIQHLNRYFLYTLLPTGFIPFSLVFSVGKDILFCNFWLVCRLKRIANVYGFQHWIFNNNFYFLELVGKEQFHMNNKHNNLPLLALKPFYSFRIRRKTDKRLLAYLPLFYVRSLDK